MNVDIREAAKTLGMDGDEFQDVLWIWEARKRYYDGGPLVLELTHGESGYQPKAPTVVDSYAYHWPILR